MKKFIKTQNEINLLDQLIIKFGTIIAILFAIATLISFFEIFMRYLFNSPTIWVHETTILLVAISFIYGGTYCLAQKSHIKINILYTIFEKNTKVIKFLNILSSFLIMVFSIAISYTAFITTKESLFTPLGIFKLETSGSAWNPPIPPILNLTLLFSTILMFIQSTLHFIKYYDANINNTWFIYGLG